MISSTGFFLEILIIGKTDETTAVDKLISKMISSCLPPNIANETNIFIVFIIYALTSAQPSTHKAFASNPLIKPINKLSNKKMSKISLPPAPSPLKTPTLRRLFAMLALI